MLKRQANPGEGWPWYLSGPHTPPGSLAESLARYPTSEREGREGHRAGWSRPGHAGMYPGFVKWDPQLFQAS